MKKISFEIRIVFAYLLAGGLWILFSDKILHHFVTDDTLLTRIQTWKGWFYVLVTGMLFFWLLRQHLKKLRQAEQEARESERLKTAFLQNMSHEIRTPMNGIIGFTGLLKSENLPEHTRQEYLKIIEKSTTRLLGIVDDILHISMMESGKIAVKNEIINANEMIGELLQIFQPLNKNHVELTIEKGLPDKEAFFVSDQVKLRQILYNLVSNALKFTKKGYIRFGYRRLGDEIEFFVKDSGIGISADLAEKVFERFNKIASRSGELYDGVGLGLALCKGNTELLNGKIRVLSEPDKGSEFFVILPFRQQT